MKYRQYAEDVLSGKVVAGELIKLAATRFINDLDRADLYFNEKKISHLLKFASVLKHYTGKHSGQPFILEPWQEFIVANIFGFYYRETGKRKYSQSYLEVSRKNGKTFMSALMCLFAMIADGEDGAEVLLAANSREQAKIAYGMCQTLSRQLDSKGQEITMNRNEINFKRTNSKLKVLAADDSKLDGYNASFALLDEYHSASNSKVRDVIKSSMGMRRSPHLCTITTAGFNKNGPCYALRGYAVDVLQGLKEDDTLFAAIYSLDEGDDWKDEDVWIKCTPNLGVTVTKEWLRSQVQQAINNPSDEVGVRTKNLNEWMDVAQVWISSQTINRVMKPVNIEFYSNEDWLCYAGVDLSAVSDLTAVTLLFTNGVDYMVKNYYFLPQSALTEKYNKELYKEWAMKGYLTLTQGNVTDYDYITNLLMEWNEKCQIRRISYDQWNATQWAVKCTELGLPLEPYSQSIGNFSGPTKELERLILSDHITIDRNPITRFCFDNVVLKSDWNQNVKPVKESNERKIDGVISIIQAIGGWQKSDHFSNEITVL